MIDSCFVFLKKKRITMDYGLCDACFPEDLINVTPEDTEYLYKIGARDAKCVLHASPWGLTLALEVCG